MELWASIYGSEPRLTSVAGEVATEEAILETRSSDDRKVIV